MSLTVVIEECSRARGLTPKQLTQIEYEQLKKFVGPTPKSKVDKTDPIYRHLKRIFLEDRDALEPKHHIDTLWKDETNNPEDKKTIL